MSKKSKPSPRPAQQDSPSATPKAEGQHHMEEIQKQLQAKLPKEAQERLKEITGLVEKFKSRVLEKFDKYVMGIALLPPKKPKEGEAADVKTINVLVLVDDSDSQKMSKEELRTKLTAIIEKMGREVSPDLAANTLILSELWQMCYDAKYDMLQLVALSAPVHDNGMLAAIKIAEVHKNMVLKKFERYIVSYVLAGSLVQGRATPQSDIDVFIVIDDTDVKKMTRAELKDKLRAIIIGMGIEAGEMTGIRNKINIQVYILSDFWLSLREANPIIFTLLRDGVPFYDRGMFTPWKQLLKQGKIKPSQEAIDLFMSTGEQSLKRVRFKLREIGMEDIFYAMLTPSQAALMLYGVTPPTPKETPQVLDELLVKKEKLLEPEYVKILEEQIQLRKDIEHGTKKDLSGAELDKYLTNAEKYLKRIEKLFKQLEKMKEEERMLETYETIVTVVRDVLRLEGVESLDDADIEKVFESRLINSGKVPEKFLRVLKNVVKAKKDYDAKRLSRTEVEEVQKGARELIHILVEYMQRKRGRELERAKIRVKHGEKFGEVTLLDKEAFIIHDIDAKEKEILKAAVKEDGSLGAEEKSSAEEMEAALAKVSIPVRVFIKGPIFGDLERIFGKNVEIMVRN